MNPFSLLTNLHCIVLLRAYFTPLISLFSPTPIKDSQTKSGHSHPSVRVSYSKMEKKSRKVHFAREETEVTSYSQATDATFLSSQVKYDVMHGAPK